MKNILNLRALEKGNIIYLFVFFIFCKCNERDRFFIIEVPKNYEGYVFIVFDSMNTNSLNLVREGSYAQVTLQYPPVTYLKDKFTDAILNAIVVIRETESRISKTTQGGSNFDQQKAFENRFATFIFNNKEYHYYQAFVTNQFYERKNDTLKVLLKKYQSQLDGFKKNFQR